MTIKNIFNTDVGRESAALLKVVYGNFLHTDQPGTENLSSAFANIAKELGSEDNLSLYKDNLVQINEKISENPLAIIDLFDNSGWYVSPYLFDIYLKKYLSENNLDKIDSEIVSRIYYLFLDDIYLHSQYELIIFHYDELIVSSYEINVPVRINEFDIIRQITDENRGREVIAHYIMHRDKCVTVVDYISNSRFITDDREANLNIKYVTELYPELKRHSFSDSYNEKHIIIYNDNSNSRRYLPYVNDFSENDTGNNNEQDLPKGF